MDENLTGQKIKHFRIGRRLGAGGMGVVYEAQDEALQRSVAVKILPAHAVGNEASRTRFLREARAAAAVTHPNIATIYQVDEDYGRIFIVMELVQGSSLAQLLERGRPSLGQALRIVSTVAQAVARAHSAGVIHRDLKPDNVMLDAEGNVKILDFGIAKRMAAEARTLALGAEQTTTQAGAILGTPGYMSPEQARGEPADARTDVFAIGVMLYELVTGQRPFQGATPVDVLAATLHSDPQPLRTFNAALPAELEPVLAHCLAKSRDARYASAHELAQALDELGGGGVATEQVVALASMPARTGSAAVHTTGAQAVEVTTRPPQVTSARLALLLSGALLGVLVLCGMAGSLWWWLHRTQMAAEQTAPTVSLAAPERLRRPEVGLRALGLYEQPADSRSTDLYSSSYWATAAQDFALHRQQPGAPPRWAAAERFSLAQAASLQGQLDEADRLLRKSLELEPSWALPHIALSGVLAKHKRLSEALAEARQAQILAPDSWAAVAAMARAHAANDEHDLAIAEFQRALRMVERAPKLMAELALAYHARRGMDAEAQRYARRALQDDPDLVSAHLLLAESLLEQGELGPALEHAGQATARSPQDVAALLIKGDVLLAMGKKDEARDALERAVKLWERTQQRHAPEERLRQVQEALARGELPPPRAPTGQRAGPPRATPRSAPRRSKPRAPVIGRRRALPD